MTDSSKADAGTIQDEPQHFHTHTHTHTRTYTHNDGPRDCHTECSKSERKRQIPYDIIYTQNLKCDTNKYIYKMNTESQDIENKHPVTKRGREWRRDKLGVWD